MKKPEFDFHPFWEVHGITATIYDEKVKWLGERRELGDGCDYFFERAGCLYEYSRSDYSISNAAFFHAVIGLERAFRLHYQAARTPFGTLFCTAVEEGLVTDELFSNPRPLPEQLAKRIENCPDEHSGRLSRLVPSWRNQYFHGICVLMPDFFFIALQLREIADALDTKLRQLPHV